MRVFELSEEVGVPSFQPKLLADARVLLVLGLGEEESSGERATEALPAYGEVSGVVDVRGERGEFGFRWSADESKAVREEAALEGSDGGGGGEVVNAGAANDSVQPGWGVTTELVKKTIVYTEFAYFRLFG